MNIIIANDHAAVELKIAVMQHLTDNNVNVEDLGATDGEKADYPDKARELCQKVTAGGYDFGILLCGTGAGMCMTANKIRGIRAVLCSEPYTAPQSRSHNDANVLCIGARVVGEGMAKMIVDAFVATPFEGGRHSGRIAKIESSV